MLKTARNRRCRVLIGDSDVAFAADFASALQARGVFVVRVGNGHDMQVEIERALASGRPADAFDLVVCDARLSGKTGLEVCEHLRGCRASPPFVFLAAPLDRFAHAQARRLRAFGIVAKPVDIEGLSIFVRSALG